MDQSIGQSGLAKSLKTNKRNRQTICRCDIEFNQCPLTFPLLIFVFPPVKNVVFLTFGKSYLIYSTLREIAPLLGEGTRSFGLNSKLHFANRPLCRNTKMTSDDQNHITIRSQTKRKVLFY